jgi:hypothetical protein
VFLPLKAIDDGSIAPLHAFPRSDPLGTGVKEMRRRFPTLDGYNVLLTGLVLLAAFSMVQFLSA